MDQKVLAGIGNIYADEILFAARIHPERMARASRPTSSPAAPGHHRGLEPRHRRRRLQLRRRLSHCPGLEGGFLAVNAMYGRAGQPCRGCGQPIQKARIAGLIGRTYVFTAPVCQTTSTAAERESFTLGLRPSLSGREAGSPQMQTHPGRRRSARELHLLWRADQSLFQGGPISAMPDLALEDPERRQNMQRE